MIIIWGWRTIRRVLATGQFHCPECRGDTEYKLLALRRWFTIFFLPVIPLKQLGQFVECQRCQTGFTEQVLTGMTLGVFEHHVGLAYRAAVAQLVSLSGPLDDATATAALELLATVPGVAPDYGNDALVADVTSFADPEVTAAYLHPLAAELTIEGREEFLRRMLVLLGRLPHPSPGAGWAVDRAAVALGVSPAHLAGIRQLVGSPTSAAGE